MKKTLVNLASFVITASLMGFFLKQEHVDIPWLVNQISVKDERIKLLERRVAVAESLFVDIAKGPWLRHPVAPDPMEPIEKYHAPEQIAIKQDVLDSNKIIPKSLRKSDGVQPDISIKPVDKNYRNPSEVQ